MTSTAAADGRRALPAVGDLRVERAVDAMASRIRAEILSGDTEPGTLLPTERDLAEQSGLSRGSVRQALQSLTAEGLLRAKVGRNGGYLVQQPPRESVIRSLDVFIRGRRIDHHSLLEAREVIEPRCAALAAERGDAESVGRLRRLTASMSDLVGDIPQFLDMNIDWHVAVAEASGNEVFASLMAAISANLRSLTRVDDYRSVEMMRYAQHLHEIVLDAIEHQDAAAAERRMLRHIDASSAVIVHPSGGHEAPAKKVPANKASVKKASVKKTSVKKTSVKKAPAKKAPAKKAPAATTAAARKTAARKTAAKAAATRQPATTKTARAARGRTQT